jgi:glucans biosynthesis protein
MARMQRRMLLGAVGACAAGLGGMGSVTQGMPDAPWQPTPFDDGTVVAMARAVAEKPHRRRADALPKTFSALDYDGYRRLRFDPGRALWKGTEVGFQLQPHHRGFLFQDRVELFEVADGTATRLRYRAPEFLKDGVPLPDSGDDPGFAGLKLLAPLNRPDHFDEVCSFLGASYFRALGRGHVYGLSARGLAIGTAAAGGEEFPAFTALWVERPAPGAGMVRLHALLESESLTGAFRFEIAPGEATTMDVAATLFPRRDVAVLGVAPGTSMFQFAPYDRDGVSDWRRAVHDSDGLLMVTGKGEQIWRPLTNPTTLQVSGFQDSGPRGFGLMQRARRLDDFQDLEAAYHRRPGLWVEPLEDWGPGEVRLVEIPTRSEIHDNIVVAWHPRGGLRGGVPTTLRYRLRWLGDGAGDPRLLRIASTRAGGSARGWRFVLDTNAEPQGPLPDAEVQASAGEIANVVVQANAETGGVRVAFELDPKGAALSEVQMRLVRGGKPASETWAYRWTR